MRWRSNSSSGENMTRFQYFPRHIGSFEAIHECYRHSFVPVQPGSIAAILSWCTATFDQKSPFDKRGRWTFRYGLLFFADEKDATSFRLKHG